MTSGKYQNMEKPLKHQRRLGLGFVVLCPAQPAVVLVLKRLRRRGNGLKSHPTNWEKPGIEPATPGLQDIGLPLNPRWRF